MKATEDPTKLIGRWSFEREIEDLRSGDRSSASGSCELVPENADLILWLERARLRHAGQEFPASRDLRVERDRDGWHVKFDDGRYFHPWLTDETVAHPCGPDLYEGVIDLGEATDSISSWWVTWRVRGPRKDLLIRTRLNRARDDDDRR